MKPKKTPPPFIRTGRTPPPCVWLLYGSYFRLPIWVKWGTYNLDYCQVKLHDGLPLLKIQRAAAEELLGRTSLGRDKDGWSFHADGLAELAVPVQGEPDVETLVRWDPEEVIYQLPREEDFSGMAGNGRNSPAVAQRVRKFLNRFVDRLGLAGFQDFGELEAFYYILCNFMMRELQTGTEVVDLVFCRLFPSPCKPQWISTHHSPWALWRWHKRSKINTWMTTRAGRTMGSQKLRKPRGNKNGATVQGWRWRLGMVLNERWVRAERETQTKLMEVLGEYGYARLNYERSAKVWPHLSESLQEWLEASTETPLAEVLASFKNARISPYAGTIRKGRPGARGQQRDGIARANAGLKAKKQKQSAAMGAADAPVPAVPDLQPAAPDLRDPGSNDGHG